MVNSWSSSRLDLHIALDATGGRRSGLESALRAAIRQGRLAAGTLLPSTRGLAQELGLSRGTVSAAYDQLVEEGYLTTRPGSGTTVVEVPPCDPVPARPMPAPTIPRHDLRPGLPDVSAFPTRAWLASTRRVLTHARPEVFGAGDPQGRIELRNALADYLGRTRGVITTPDRIVITSGYYQGLGLLCGALTAGGTGTAAVEDPGHNVFRDVIQRAGFTTLALPVDLHGARVQALTQEVGAVFLTPSHQYPTGVPLHPSRRQTLYAWARSTGGVIVEDDYDGEYRYQGAPLAPLAALDRHGRVLYVGTFSKIAFPGLRLGYLVAPPALVPALLELQRAGIRHLDSATQTVMADFIEQGHFQRHIRRMRRAARSRRDALLAGWPEVAGCATPSIPVAGLHLCLPVASLPREAELVAQAAAVGVELNALSRYWLPEGPTPPDARAGLVLGFAAVPEAQIEQALARLRGAWA
jgi:GntR family transcriptional regulator/MocR family aminotransferase